MKFASQKREEATKLMLSYVIYNHRSFFANFRNLVMPLKVLVRWEGNLLDAYTDTDRYTYISTIYEEKQNYDYNLNNKM